MTEDLDRMVASFEAKVPASWMPIDINPVLSGEVVVPEPNYARRSDGLALFYAGRVNGVHSPTENGKSWAAALACTEAITDGGRAAYFDFESDESDVVGRFMAIGVPNIAGGLDYMRPDDAIGDAAAVALAEHATYDVVVLDGVTEALSMLGLNSNHDVDIATFHRRLARSFAQAGACVVLVDHVTKGGGVGQRFATGSQHKLSGITGAAYEVQMVRPFGRGMSGEAKIILHKDKLGFVRGWAKGAKVVGRMVLDATIDPASLVVHPPGSDDSDRGLAPSVATILDLLGDEQHPMRNQEIGDAIKAGPWPQGYKRETVARGLAKLASLGLADSADGSWWRCE